MRDYPERNGESGVPTKNVLSEAQKQFVISYESMKEIIKKYYESEGKNVKVRIEYTEGKNDGIYYQPADLSIEVREITTILGKKSASVNKLSMDDLKMILSTSLKKEGKTLLKVENNATKSSRTIGYGMGEHEETVITGKNFTVTVK